MARETSIQHSLLQLQIFIFCWYVGISVGQDCLSSVLPQEAYNASTGRNETSTGSAVCLNTNGSIYLQFSTGQTISSIELQGANISVNQGLRYSYNQAQYYPVDRNFFSLNGKNITFRVPIYCRFFELDVIVSENVTSCFNVSLTACRRNAVPSLSLIYNTSSADGSLNITCSAFGQPDPLVSWAYLRNGSQPLRALPLTSSNGVLQGVQHSLLLLDRRNAVQQMLTCDKSSLNCTGVFVCTAGYEGSMATESKNITVYLQLALPDKPGQVTALRAGNNEVRVTWQQPLFQGDLSIEEYHLSLVWRTGNRTASFPGNATSYATLLQVDVCVGYNLTVTASTSFGGGKTASLRFITENDVDQLSTRIDSVSSSSATVLWNLTFLSSACNASNGSLLNITYACQNVSHFGSSRTCGNATTITVSAFNSSSQTINNLHPAATYTYFITLQRVAISDVFQSSTLQFETLESTPSGTVQDLSFSVTGGRNISLTWMPIALSEQNGVIRRYNVVYKPAYSTENMTDVDADVRGLNISNLDYCGNYTYTFRVSGCTTVGCGPYASVKYITEEGRLGPIVVTVQDATVSSASTASVTVSIEYSAPSHCITGYHVQYRVNGGPWLNRTDSVTQLNGPLTVTVSPLEYFTVYEFRARLVFLTSVGNWSEVKGLKTVAGRAGMVRSFTAQSISATGATLVWEPPEKANGEPLQYIITYRGTRDYDPTFSERPTLLFVGASDRRKELTGVLSVATTYVAAISLRNNAANGIAAQISFNTLARTPASPTLSLRSDSVTLDAMATIELSAVTNANGPVTSYDIIVLRQLPNFVTLPPNFDVALYNHSVASSLGLNYYLHTSVPQFSGSLQLILGRGNISGSADNPSLSSGYDYTIFSRSVITWTNQRLPSNLVSVSIFRYPLTTNLTVDPTGISDKTFTVNLIRISPEVRYVRIVVTKLAVDNNGKPVLPSEAPNNVSDVNITVYTDRKSGSSNLPYVTAELSNTYFTTHQRFIIGDGSSSSRDTRVRRHLLASTEFENGPLDPASYYSFFFRTYHDGGSFFSTAWAPAVQTKPKEVVPMPPQKSADSRVGLAVGISVVVVVFIIVVGFVMWRMSRMFYLQRDRGNSVELKSHQPYLNGVHNEAYEREKLNFADSRYDYDSMDVFHLSYSVDAAHPPVKVGDFPDYVAQIKQTTGFGEEFDSLISGEYTCDLSLASAHDDNGATNANLYHDSKVFLKEDRGENSDVNANFVDAYHKSGLYIATQMPQLSSRHAFWAMVWQEDVRTIVVLSGSQEAEQLGSFAYWPNSDRGSVCQYGNICVSPRSPEDFASHEKRPFAIQSPGEPHREVMLFVLKAWPNSADGEGVKMLLSFRVVVQLWSTKTGGRILVQCSKGTGRTGVFIAMDAILENVKTSRTVDVFNYVNYMRSQRAHLVETAAQYELLHDVIVEALTDVQTELEVHAANVDDVVERLCNVDNVTGYTGFRKLFKQLNRSMPSPSTFDAFEGHKPTNEYKNRYSNKVPNDKYRWRYSSLRCKRESDYINATMVHLTSCNLRMITTQAPFGVTLLDFWAMVRDSQAKVVVMLNETHEGVGVFPEYWPTADVPNMTQGNIKLTLELESSPISGVTKREFTMSGVDDAGSEREVQHYHIRDWPDRGIPNTRGPTLGLVDTIVQNFASDIDPPIVIHCSDGLGRSGVFAAILAGAKSYVRHRRIHIPDIVKEVRAHHPYYIETESQFRFIFDVLRDFIRLENSKEMTRL